MQLLILFISENEQFDQNKLVDIVKNIPGIENIREGEFVGSILEFEFREGEDFTTVRLSGDRETISISGLGDASLKIALSIRKRYPQPIIAVDSDYSFELVLDKINSLDQLRQKILDSSYQTVN
ncbi:MAG: hypothetical protein F6K18_24885 [Okeania sp. SIO2C2]|uniref:hypothetical protein n=1 Tax=Okeania sp. SIO2C2 TaxID=2607787 RepID=UPI0013B995B9|nr:hypothetical protein [Okeania sp. SIO2C2]NEP89804.1 hypothetical protein [Okeania sp. SIO2C2]